MKEKERRTNDRKRRRGWDGSSPVSGSRERCGSMENLLHRRHLIFAVTVHLESVCGRDWRERRKKTVCDGYLEGNGIEIVVGVSVT